MTYTLGSRHRTTYKTNPPPNNQVLCLSTADMRRTLCRVNPRKFAGPDNIPGRVVRECAEQLVHSPIFTDIFNISLSSAVVPTCLKTTTIVPMPKKSTVSCLNNYRPVALTPIVLKYFERLVMRQDPATTITGPLAVCVSSKSLHGQYYQHNPPSVPHSPGQ
ncbi:hypothetical protein QTP70_000320 [Hemibagrus guttatus]|uniref:Reverse transcriptase n=1 Tax=Hemibagrus guttatus TaxID=175788 RepID=A0AAE0UNL9_9TELE|nr:hypothetical protein QTP70_000320 [Hemibagrus guttatus]